MRKTGTVRYRMPVNTHCYISINYISQAAFITNSLTHKKLDLRFITYIFIYNNHKHCLFQRCNADNVELYIICSFFTYTYIWRYIRYFLSQCMYCVISNNIILITADRNFINLYTLLIITLIINF